MTNPRTLAQMHNRPTAYEVAINGEVVAYTARKTRNSLLTIAKQNKVKVYALIGDTDPDAVYTKANGWTFGAARVYFTGRTEREAATAIKYDANGRFASEFTGRDADGMATYKLGFDL